MNQIQVSCNKSSDGILQFCCSVRPSVLFMSTSLILCPSFFVHSIDPMLSSSPTNVVLFDKLYEAHCLGHASLISIITTINLLLVSINDVIKRNKKGGSRPYYPHIKRNQRMLQSLKNEYGSLFQRTYRMDYVAFKSLYRLLQSGIQEYLINEREINDGNNGLDFYMRNGRITTEIRLACALRYFAGGSYLDIMLSHGIGKTDLYRSIWAVVHAMNASTPLKFSFPTTSAQCESIATEFSHRSKVGFRNCIGCIDGMLVWTEKRSKSQCMEVGVNDGKFYCGRKDAVSPISRYSTLLQLPTT